MPGENCAIFGCSASRKNKGISFFKVPLPNNEMNKKWGNELINMITKDREVDNSLKKRIETRKLFICEQHFSEEQYYKYDTRKSLKDGELPKLNSPMKSGTKTPSRRPTSSIQKRDEFLVLQALSPPLSPYVYKDFNEFTHRIVKLSLDNCWEVKLQNNLAILNYVTANYVMPKIQIFIDQSLSFSLRLYGWMLTEDHELYVMHNRSFLNVTLSNFIQRLENYVLCDGITIQIKNAVFKSMLFQKYLIILSINNHSLNLDHINMNIIVPLNANFLWLAILQRRILVHLLVLYIKNIYLKEIIKYLY